MDIVRFNPSCPVVAASTIEINKKVGKNMKTKKQAIEELKKEEKQALTIKVTTILKVIAIMALVLGAYVLGWVNRSDFSNEVKGEVRSVLSVNAELKDKAPLNR